PHAGRPSRFLDRFPVAPRHGARSHIPMPGASPTVDESFAQLHAAGWSVGDVRLLTPAGPRGPVTATSRENAIRGEGCTQAEAWQRACKQARAWDAGEGAVNASEMVVRRGLLGVFVAEVGAQAKLLRSNWIQGTGLEGSPRYDASPRRTGNTFR